MQTSEPNRKTLYFCEFNEHEQSVFAFSSTVNLTLPPNGLLVNYFLIIPILNVTWLGPFFENKKK
ncbi:hypothetical protein BLOT_014034 [Blomia tropicalis]|nr:hypothetical protein BLOT_014034 [Blomia tropicalis]